MLPSPLSAVPDIAWPAIPRPEGSIVLALVQQLEHSQWWTPEQLWEMQRQQLASLAAHAATNVSFYKERLGSLGRPGNPPATVEQWRELPILTRKDIQISNDELKSRNLGGEHGEPESEFSSGSTGEPIMVWHTAITALFWRACTIREHQWHSRDFSQSIAAIRKVDTGTALYPDGYHGKQWGPATTGLFPTGPSHLLNLMTRLDDQAEWLRRQNPSYLMTSPVNLDALARHCIKQGITFPGLRQVRVQGEIMRPEVREVCREAWGVAVTDIYSAMEVGHIAAQCPEHEHYHIMSERLLVEILDEAGNPCGPGETGKVVITDMHNFAFPLIRYEIGDYAEAGEPCPCGRGLPVLNQIVGRARNMLTLPSGELMQPAFEFTDLTVIAPIRQMQFVQKTLNHIELRLVVDSELDVGQERAIQDLIVERLGHAFKVTFTYMDDIPRSEGGKFEDFVSEVTS